MALPDPELDTAAAAMVDEGARFVVVGGFCHRQSIRASYRRHRFPRSRRHGNDHRILAALRKLDGVRFRDDEPLRSEHLVGQAHLRARTSAGLIDVMRGGLPPLDFETVADRAMTADYGRVEFLVAGLSSIVGFKRLADRPRDRNDLIGLAEIHGELPVEPIPGLDS